MREGKTRGGKIHLPPPRPPVPELVPVRSAALWDTFPPDSSQRWGLPQSRLQTCVAVSPGRGEPARPNPPSRLQAQEVGALSPFRGGPMGCAPALGAPAEPRGEG